LFQYGNYAQATKLLEEKKANAPINHEEDANQNWKLLARIAINKS